MSLETSRLRITGVTGGPLRITGATLVNGAYELATAGGADYELQTERQTTMDNILFIPGIANPVSEINQLLFGQGQPGGSWIPTLSSAMIAANSFGSGVTDILDLSGRNNPFSQATPSSRGAWFREPKRGRVNLVDFSQDRGNAYWVNINTSVTPNAAVAPDGTLTADKIIVNNGETFSAINTTNRSGALTLEVDLRYIVSFFAKPDGFNRVSVRISTAPTMGAGPRLDKTVNMIDNTDTGTIGSYLGRTPAANGYFRYFFRTVPVATATNYLGTSVFDSVATTGNGVDGGLVWGTQIEPETPELLPTAYQRSTTAFDVTEQGQRDCYGVRLDGTDDWYERAINFSGTDKVTLFVAMRRRSDAARGTVLELTSSIDSNNGAFHLTAPNAASATFGFESKGTTLRDAVITQAMGNPRIITAIGDIAGDLASIQVDNGTPTTNTGDQGSGNYANSTLYLGRRGGSSLSLNGDIFGVIAAGGEYTAATRQRVRTILSRITPTVNL
jgi:hypothetical protein